MLQREATTTDAVVQIHVESLQFVDALRDLLRALDVSDVKMEQGSMRCDVNLSLRPKVGDDPAAQAQLDVPLGTRTAKAYCDDWRAAGILVR